MTKCKSIGLKWLMNISLVNWFTFTFCLDFSIVLWGIILRLPKLASLKDTADEYLVVLPTSTQAAIISLQSHSVWQRWQCQTFLSFFRDCLWIFNMRQLVCEMNIFLLAKTITTCNSSNRVCGNCAGYRKKVCQPIVCILGHVDFEWNGIGKFVF